MSWLRDIGYYIELYISSRINIYQQKCCFWVVLWLYKPWKGYIGDYLCSVWAVVRLYVYFKTL